MYHRYNYHNLHFKTLLNWIRTISSSTYLRSTQRLWIFLYGQRLNIVLVMKLNESNILWTFIQGSFNKNLGWWNTVYRNNIKKVNYENLPGYFLPIGISVSYDISWQKRSRGRVFDSLSGHVFVGCLPGATISKGVLQKHCSFCTTCIQQNLDIPKYDCNINHNGSSGSMETILILQLINELND